jgi:phosphatidylglycerol:prolipoprotein diacylglycerol transferase
MNWFGIFAAVGALVAMVWLWRNHKKLGVTENEFWAALWLMSLGGIVGAKGVFVWLGWEHYASGELDLWRDFSTGFVFFGGLVGAMVAGLAFAAVRKLSFWRGADYFAVALPMGHAIGRVGCFLTGCCPGRGGHPVQLYESAGLLLISVICARVTRRIETGALPRGTAFCIYGTLYGFLRLVMDPLRADGRPERWFGISHQQGIALGIMLASLIAFACLRNRHLFQSFKLQS